MLYYTPRISALIAWSAALTITMAGTAGTAELRPPNDDFVSIQRLEGPTGRLACSSGLPTRESAEPSDYCSERVSLWWHWTAETESVASFRVALGPWEPVPGHVAVYEGVSPRELVRIEEIDERDASCRGAVGFHARPSTTYHIAVYVDGRDPQWIDLSWRSIPVRGSELPADAECALAPDAASVPEGSPPARPKDPGPPAPGGSRELFEASDPRLLEVWEATGALIPRSELTRHDDGTWSIDERSWRRRWLASGDLLWPEEPGANQPNPARATGFLVAPGVVATAGRLPLSDWSDLVFVRGFRMLDRETVVCTFPASRVHRFTGVVDTHCLFEAGLGDATIRRDCWTLLAIDGAVEDIEPLRLRLDGKVDESSKLVVMGHPHGLPAKLRERVAVEDNRFGAYFYSDLETFDGSEGSPVLDVDTLEVEGILLDGRPAYDRSPEGWKRSLQVHDPEELINARVLRAEELPVVEGSFRRGDVDGTGTVDVTDAIRSLRFLFAGELAPDCEDAADANDDGELDLSDPIAILMALFAGGGLPAPTSACGADPTRDRLRCAPAPGGCS